MSKLRTFLHKQKKDRIEKNLASIIIIDGMMGTGKTTLGIRSLEEYQGRKQINYKVQYAVGGKDFMKKLQLCIDNKYSVIIYDEAGDFSKKTTLAKINRTIDRIFQIYRTFKILVIIILPSFTDLDKGIYKRGVVRAVINCYLKLEHKLDSEGNKTLDKKGKEIRELTKGHLRIYSARRIAYMFNYIKKYQPVIEQMVYTKGSSPNVKSKFYNLPPERELELQEISDLQKKEQLRDIEGKENFDPMSYVKEVLLDPEKYKQGKKGFNTALIRAYLSVNERQSIMIRSVATKESEI